MLIFACCLCCRWQRRRRQLQMRRNLLRATTTTTLLSNPQPGLVVTQQVPVIVQQPQFTQAQVMVPGTQQTPVAIPIAVATQAYPDPAYAQPIAEATLVSN